jgi:glucose-1-phosphate thymidylyltransferase
MRDAAQMLRAIETQFEQNRQTKGEFYIADALQIMVEQGAKFVAQPVRTWLDTGKPETVLETNRYLLENGFDNSASTSIPHVTVVPPVNIHLSAKLEHAVIGPHVTIAADCEIRYSIIRDSVVERGASITHAVLEQSLIGERARVEGRLQNLNIGDDSSVQFG